MYLLAQVLGVIGIVLTFFIFSARRRQTILLSKLTGDVIWVIHYFLIGAYSGAGMNIICTMREIVFFNKEKKWASHRFWLFLFIALNITSGLLTWEGWISLLPMFGSCCTVMSFWCTKPLHIRLVAAPGQTLWLLYAILHVTPTSIICNAFSLVSIAIGLCRDISAMRKAKQA